MTKVGGVEFLLHVLYGLYTPPPVCQFLEDVTLKLGSGLVPASSCRLGRAGWPSPCLQPSLSMPGHAHTVTMTISPPCMAADRH